MAGTSVKWSKQWSHLIKLTNGQGDMGSHSKHDNRASQGGHRGPGQPSS